MVITGISALLILLIILAVTFGPEPESASAPTPAPTEFTVVGPQPTSTPALIATGHLLDLVEEARTLYAELQGFKDDPEFYAVGFAVCCRYNEWMLRVEEFDKRVEQNGYMGEFSSKTGFVPRELIALGFEYLQGGELVNFWEMTIEAGLAVTPELVDGQGTVTNTDIRCNSMETYKEHLAKLDSGDFAGANAIIYGPDCIRVYQNTVVAGPTDMDSFMGRTYHLFALPDGTTLWFREGAVALE